FRSSRFHVPSRHAARPIWRFRKSLGLLRTRITESRRPRRCEMHIAGSCYIATGRGKSLAELQCSGLSLRDGAACLLDLLLSGARELLWVTFSLTLISPLPRTLTGCLARTRPAATRSATATSPPFGKAFSRSETFTTWKMTLLLFLNPLSFGRRICSGIWPPSKYAGTLLRALVPFVPRPAVLPLDASPRPTRVLALFAPLAGRRSWSLIGSLIFTPLPLLRPRPGGERCGPCRG